MNKCTRLHQLWREYCASRRCTCQYLYGTGEIEREREGPKMTAAAIQINFKCHKNRRKEKKNENLLQNANENKFLSRNRLRSFSFCIFGQTKDFMPKWWTIRRMSPSLYRYKWIKILIRADKCLYCCRSLVWLVSHKSERPSFPATVEHHI